MEVGSWKLGVGDALARMGWGFGFRASFVIWLSSFVIPRQVSGVSDALARRVGCGGAVLATSH